MKSSFMRALYRGAVLNGNYTPPQDEGGRAAAFREELNILVKPAGGADYILEIIDGDALDAAQITERLRRNSEFAAQTESNRYRYVVELFVFDTAPDAEKATAMEHGQLHNPVRRAFVKCLSVSLAEQKLTKHYKAPAGTLGMKKLVEKAFSVQDAPALTTEEIEAMAQKRRQALKLEFRAKVPVFTYVFIAVNLLAWLALALYSMQTGKSYDSLLYLFGEKENALIMGGEYWRLFAPMFLHAGLTHVAVNCFSLFVFGMLIERIFGHTRFVFIYLLAGFLGNVTSFVFSVNPSVGASGAIFGLMGALLWLGVERPQLFRVYFGIGVVATIAVNLAYGLTNPSIDNFGHLGGLLGGFLAAGVVYPRSGGERVRVNKPVMAVLALLVTAGFLAGGFYNPNNRAYPEILRLDTLASQKKNAEVVALGEKILAYHLTDKQLLTTVLADLADAQMQQGNTDKALGYAKQMQHIDEANGHYMAAVIYINTGSYAQARSELLAVQKINPSYQNLSQLFNIVNQALGQK